MNDQLAEIEALLDKATPGPWEDASTDNGPFDYEVHTSADGSWSLVGLMPSPHDARLIAKAPTYLRDLVPVVKAARDVDTRCVDALRRGRYEEHCGLCSACRLRDALASLKGGAS